MSRAVVYGPVARLDTAEGSMAFFSVANEESVQYFDTRRKDGKRIAPINPPRPVPADWETNATVMRADELKALYGVSDWLITRWRKETGIRGPGRRPDKRPSARRNFRQAPISVKRDTSVAGRAVDECLQKLGRIFRCDADGTANPKGTHWNRNGFILTDDDVIQRARRNGWSPDDWERIAA